MLGLLECGGEPGDLALSGVLEAAEGEGDQEDGAPGEAAAVCFCFPRH